MHMQLYLQLAEINTKVDAARSLLAKVEKRQAALQQLLPQRQTRNLQVAAQPIQPPVAPQQEISGDDYLDGLIGMGRWVKRYPMYR
jgi:hypothetical protein